MDTQEIIKLTSLLTKACGLLLKSHEARCYGLAALKRPPEQRKELTAETKEWLISKTEDEIEEIESFVCQSEKYIGLDDCDVTEQEQKALDILRHHPKWLEKLITAGEREIK